MVKISVEAINDAHKNGVTALALSSDCGRIEPRPKKNLTFFSGFRSVWGVWNLAGWELWDVFFLCETKIFAPGNWMVGTLIVSFLGALFRPSF